MENLFDFENDFTEEEEAVFASKQTAVAAQPVSQMPTLEEGIVLKYKAGVPVIKLLETYGLSTGRLYDILKSSNTPLRVSKVSTGANKPANLFKKEITTTGYVFTGDLAKRYGLTPGQVRSYCVILEEQGYEFARGESGQRRGRIFNQKDIEVVDKMIEAVRLHSMVEAATLALYNHDVQQPKVNVKLEGETIYIHIERMLQWTADEINVVINLKEEN